MGSNVAAWPQPGHRIRIVYDVWLVRLLWTRKITHPVSREPQTALRYTDVHGRSYTTVGPPLRLRALPPVECRASLPAANPLSRGPSRPALIVRPFRSASGSRPMRRAGQAARS